MTAFALALILLGLASLLELAPLPDVANVAMVLSLATAVIVLRTAHRSVDWSVLRATAWGTVPGVALGVMLLGRLDAGLVVALRRLLGLVIVACALAVLMQALVARFVP